MCDYETETGKYVGELLALPTLQVLGQAKLTPEQFRAFSLERHATTLHFVPLLKAGLRAASQINDTALYQVLRQNWRDETGRDAHDVVTKANAHATWRTAYLGALGLKGVARPPQWSGTKRYASTIKSLIDQHDHLVIGGAVLMIEAFIPPEFERIVQARDHLFRETFVHQANESEEATERKDRARLYLDDHIVHDKRWHFPDLLAALQPHQDPTEVRRVVRGIRSVALAKTAFYKSAAVTLRH